MLRTNVFISITLLPELPSTNLTRIWPFISMNPPVIIQGISPEESLLTNLPTNQALIKICTLKKNTYIATISTIIRMYQTMLIIHRTSQKTLVTYSTLKGSLTCVNFTDVILQIGANCIARLASFMRTREGLYTYK